MSSADLADPHTLVGTWELSRVIDDRLAGAESHVVGLLELAVVSPTRISWQETGSWHQPGGDVPVRRGLWLDRLEHGEWWVRFEDERDFHAWTPGSRVVHPCSPDTYTGLVEGTPTRWTVVWDVSGPHKDYTMRTVLTRTG